LEHHEPSEPQAPAADAPRVLHSMWETWQELCQSLDKRSLRAWLHESQFDLSDVHTQYSVGVLNLSQRAYAEQLHLALCIKINSLLSTTNRAHRPVIDELQERLADKLYVNFSLFQSMPDSWGIDQLFPVLPLEHLNEAPTRRAVLLDITCDSDGEIDQYIDGDGVETTMPMPEYDPENPPLLGFFMVGAYQEILGNMHNLFGDTASMDVQVFENGDVEVYASSDGDTVATMLEYVRLDPETLLGRYRDQVQASGLPELLQQQYLSELEAGLYGYTYLEEI
ncbi:MAG: arginine decarboxylase, partial [Plesiomonas sp.]